MNRSLVWTSLAPLVGVVLLCCGCASMPSGGGSFSSDVEFLKKHQEVIVLSSDDGRARVAVVPAYQGRVMTSTAGGERGDSYGWINYNLVASGEIQPHINVFGGEDRFWLGPEGGQFALFFSGDDPFDLEHWQTPAAIDTERYKVTARNPEWVAFRHSADLYNKSGTRFALQIDRLIRLLDRESVQELLGLAIPAGTDMVAYESENRVTNIGSQPWTRESGLLSIWILGMFRPGSETTVVVPFRPGPESELGPRVNAAYFGEVPPDRLVVGERRLFFKADGRYRSKIGIPPRRALRVCGSYDARNGVLTVVQYTRPEGAMDYVNSMWEHQQQPFAGDVVNAYNDGPPAPGKKPLGPFYELESSSPALALKPGASGGHVHRTMHFQGPEPALDTIAQGVLGVDLETVENAFSAEQND